jgi:hypothetical protein
MEDNKGGSEAARNLRAKFRIDPIGARSDVTRAFEMAEGDAGKAAALLGIGRRTLLRIIKDPALARIVRGIRAKAAEATP